MAQTAPKILIVDDEKNYLDDFASLFSSQFSILTAPGGEEALAILKKEPIGIIVSDQRMPKMSGSQFLAEAAKLYPNTVRILLTGYSDIDAVIDAVNRGEIYRYVAKNLPLKEIEIVIRQAVEKFRIEDYNRELLSAKKRLLKSLAVQQNLSTVGTLGQQLHQKIEGLVMNLFNYVFQMKQGCSEQEFLTQFHKLQGALGRLRELSSFSERMKRSGVGLQRGGLNLLLQEAASRAKASGEKSGKCAVELDLATNLPELSLQRYSIMRVMKELLENALLFTARDDKKIIVRTRYLEAGLEGGIEVEPAIRIDVEDNGPGLGGQDPAVMFAPFYSSLALQDPPGGMLPPVSEDYNLTPYYHFGFGLPIAQWIICLRHHGTIDLASRPGKGTVASVTLPLEQ